jgi:hypothetical protein
MNTNKIKNVFTKSSFFVVVILTLICTNFSFSSQYPDSLKIKKSQMNLPNGQAGLPTGKQGMDMKEDESADTSIIRKGVIDLKAIDKNKDGKVFQCPMDYNVISDKPGIDPQCGMKLKEVTLAKAKKNLIGAGYKVK